jgi:hypothetical protein
MPLAWALLDVRSEFILNGGEIMHTSERELSALARTAAGIAGGPSFLMFPGERHGWVVMLDGEPYERHEFVDRRLALDYAKSWAAGNRPSSLRVLDDMGTPTQAWSFA